MKNNWIHVLATASLLVLALACGGGGSSSSEVSTSDATLRLKGGKTGDTISVYDLSGNMVTSGAFDSAGDVSIGVSADYSLHLKMEIGGVVLFETLVTRDELQSASYHSSSDDSSYDTKPRSSTSGSLSVTMNAATTVLAQESSSYFLDIYNAEVALIAEAAAAAAAEAEAAAAAAAEEEAAAAVAEVEAEGSIPAAATISDNAATMIGFLQSSSWSTTFNYATETSTIADGTTASFSLTSDGKLNKDEVHVASFSELYGTAPYQNLKYEGVGITYQVSLTGQEGDETRSLNEINVYEGANWSGQYVYGSAPAKPRMTVSYSSLYEMLSSMFGTSSLSSVSLSSVASNASLSSYLDKIEMMAIVTSIAVRAADEGNLTAANWTAVVSAVDTALSAGASSEAAATLSAVLQANLVVTTPLTVADFGTEMAAFLGDGDDVANILSAVQSGDSAGALGLISIATGQTASTAFSKGTMALENEDVLEAYEFFSTAVSLDPTHDNARLLAALTRFISVGIKNTPEVKAFQQAANLEYTFKDNDSLEALLDDDDAFESKTIYGDIDQVEAAGLPSLSDVTTFVKDAYLEDIKASIADLEAINLSSYAGFTLTVAMQGTDDTGAYNATSPVDFDATDVETLLGQMYLIKAHAENFLGLNLSVSGVNDTQANMFNTAMDATTEVKINGTGTLVGVWEYESGTSFDDSLVPNISLEGDFPGELLVSGFSGGDDFMEIYTWETDEVQWLIDDHADKYSGKTFAYKAEGWFKVISGTKTIELSMHFGVPSLSAGSIWIGTVFVDVYDSSTETWSNSTYHTEHTLQSGSTLVQDTTVSEINEATAVSWINSNTSFLTLAQTYMNASRDSVEMAAQLLGSAFDTLQEGVADGVTSDRLDNLFDSFNLEFDDGMVMTTAEEDAVQSFLGDLVDTLDGPATVNGTFIASDFGTAQMDLSAFFEKAPRDLLVNTSNQAITSTDSDGSTMLEGDEDEVTSTLEGTLTSAAAFAYSSGNIYEKYESVALTFEDWLDDGVLNEFNDALLLKGTWTYDATKSVTNDTPGEDYLLTGVTGSLSVDEDESYTATFSFSSNTETYTGYYSTSEGVFYDDSDNEGNSFYLDADGTTMLDVYTGDINAWTRSAGTYTGADFIINALQGEWMAMATYTGVKSTNTLNLNTNLLYGSTLTVTGATAVNSLNPTATISYTLNGDTVDQTSTGSLLTSNFKPFFSTDGNSIVWFYETETEFVYVVWNKSYSMPL